MLSALRGLLALALALGSDARILRATSRKNRVCCENQNATWQKS